MGPQQIGGIGMRAEVGRTDVRYRDRYAGGVHVTEARSQLRT
jgi:hypothetical protein